MSFKPSQVGIAPASIPEHDVLVSSTAKHDQACDKVEQGLHHDQKEDYDMTWQEKWQSLKDEKGDKLVEHFWFLSHCIALACNHWFIAVATISGKTRRQR